MKKNLPFTLNDALLWREKYNTPIYVYDKEGIVNTVRNIYKAFSWNEGFTECFAVKATPTPAIIRLLASLGCGTDCASISELLISRSSGLSNKKIMFTSNQSSEEDYRCALSMEAIINLDDITQIEILERASKIPDTVCLRFNPGTFEMTNNIMGHLYDSKFGMTKDQLFDSYKILKEKGVKHFGLHAMLASCSLDNSYYPTLAKLLFSLVVEIKNTLGIEIEFVDFGGGIGIPYKDEEPVDIFKIGEDVHTVYDQIIKSSDLKVSIYTEMGRYITGPHGYLLTTVRGKKDIYKKYIGLDATACDMMRPAMYGSYHHITVLGKEDQSSVGIFDVCGSLCENNDKFAIDRPLCDVSYGDILVIHDSGAHGRSMGYNYNGKLRCGELLMDKDKSVSLIRRSENLSDLFSTFDVDLDFKIEV